MPYCYVFKRSTLCPEWCQHVLNLAQGNMVDLFASGVAPLACMRADAKKDEWKSTPAASLSPPDGLKRGCRDKRFFLHPLRALLHDYCFGRSGNWQSPGGTYVRGSVLLWTPVGRDTHRSG